MHNNLQPRGAILTGEQLPEWYASVQNRLEQVNGALSDFFLDFRTFINQDPVEATLTDILALGLSKWQHPGVFFRVTRTTQSLEGTEGHDLTLKLFRRLPTKWVYNPTTGEKVRQMEEHLLWVCYLQAKRLKVDIADFAYRYSTSTQKLKEDMKNVNNKLALERRDRLKAARKIEKARSKLEEEGTSNRARRLDELELDFKMSTGQYTKKISSLEESLNDLWNELKSVEIQMSLLRDNLRLRTLDSMRHRSDHWFTAGYVVYNEDGAYYFPLHEVLQKYREVQSNLEQDQRTPTQENISKAMTIALRGLPAAIAGERGLKNMLPNLEFINIDHLYDLNSPPEQTEFELGEMGN